MNRFLSLALALMLLPMPVAAHEVQYELKPASATVVQLRYADGQAFAFEAYEVSLPGDDRPVQVGRTDAEGRLLILPSSAELRVRAFSADGHGVEFKLNPTLGGEATAPGTGNGRNARLVLGAGILLALFGLGQLFVRRNNKP